MNCYQHCWLQSSTFRSAGLHIQGSSRGGAISSNTFMLWESSIPCLFESNNHNYYFNLKYLCCIPVQLCLFIHFNRRHSPTSFRYCYHSFFKLEHSVTVEMIQDQEGESLLTKEKALFFNDGVLCFLLFPP